MSQTEPDVGRVAGELISMFHLINDPQLAKIYTSIHTQGPVEIKELSENSDLSKTKIYNIVDKLLESNIIEIVSEIPPKTYRARDLELIVESTNVGKQFKLTPAFVEAVAYQDTESVIEDLVTKKGLPELATALEYTLHWKKGTVSRYLYSNDTNMELIITEQILQALEPVVVYHNDFSVPEIYDNFIPDRIPSKAEIIVGLGTIIALHRADQVGLDYLKTVSSYIEHPVTILQSTYTEVQKQQDIQNGITPSSVIREGISDDWIRVVGAPNKSISDVSQSMRMIWDDLADQSSRFTHEITEKSTFMGALQTQYLISDSEPIVYLIDTDILTLDASLRAQEQLGIEERAQAIHPEELITSSG